MYLGANVSPVYKRYTGGMVNMRAPVPNGDMVPSGGIAARMKATADRMIAQRVSVASRPHPVLKRATPLSALVCPPGFDKFAEGTRSQRCVKRYVAPPLLPTRPKATPCPTGTRWDSRFNKCMAFATTMPVPTPTIHFEPRIQPIHFPQPVPATRPPLLPQPVAVGPVASPAASASEPEPKAGGPVLDQPAWVDVLLSAFKTPSATPPAAVSHGTVMRSSSIGPSQPGAPAPAPGMDIKKILMYGVPIGVVLFLVARKK